MAIRLESKRPAEVRDYRHDWTPFLGSDTIAASVWTVEGATLDDDTHEAGFATVWVSGGSAGVPAVLVNTITTDGGRTETERFVLPIVAADEPVSLAELKLHLRVDGDAEDRLIADLGRAAREHIERLTGRVLVQRTFVDTFRGFDDFLELARGPVVSVDRVTYRGSDAADAELEAADLTAFVESEPVRVYPLSGSWPTAHAHAHVRVAYTAGYDEGLVPGDLVAAIKLLAAHLYANRESVVTGISVAELPHGVADLCRPYRRQWLG